MALKASSSETPDYLLPRIGNLPVSNAHYFKQAHITEITPPPADPFPAHAQWVLREPARQVHEGAVKAIAVSRDASIIVTGGADGQVLVHDAANADQPARQILANGDAIAALSFDPTGKWLVATDSKGNIWVWRASTWALLQGPLAKRTNPATGIYFLHGKLILAPRETHDAGMQVFQRIQISQLIENPLRETEPWSVLAGGSYVKAAFSGSPQTSIVAVFGLKSQSVGFWSELEGGNQLASAQEPHKASISAIAINQTGARAATGDESGQLAIWNPANGERVGPILNAHSGAITQLVFDPEFPALYSAGEDGRILMFGVGLGDTLIMPLETGAPIHALAVAGNRRLLVAGDENGRVHSWFDDSQSISQPLKIASPKAAFAHSRPAVGVMLTHEQSWAMQGVAQGELLHSVSLAPGEVTQLAVSNHTQTVLKNSVDAASQSDLMQQSGTSASELHETEKTDASEFGFGFSSASSSSQSDSNSSPGLLGLLGFTGGAASTNTTASTASFSMGHRNVSDSANQSLHQSTSQRAAMARRRFSAAVQEVSESDSLELKTRVVANYNHMHALNLQYYEAVQVKRLRTRVVDAHRLLFIPMKPTEFSDAPSARTVLQRFPHQIAAILHQRGHEAAAIAVGLLYIGGDVGSASLRQSRFDRVWSALNTAVLDLAQIKVELKEAENHATTATNAVLKDRDALRKLQNTQDAGLYDRNILQQSLIANQQMEQSAKKTLKKRRAQVHDLQQRLDILLDGREKIMAFLQDASGFALEKEVLKKAMQMPETGEISAAAVVDGVHTEDSQITLSVEAEAPTLDDAQVAAMERFVREILRQHELAVNQHLWLTLDPTTYGGLLQGHTFRGKRIAAEVDPSPVAIAGHYVGFRWHHRNAEEAEAFREQYVHSPPVLEDAIALPTGGVFAEAVLGESNVADKIDLTRFWDWKNALPPIRPTGIDALKQPGDVDLTAPQTAKVPASQLDLGQITFPEVASGMPNIVEALKNPELFDNLSGTKASAALATSAMQLSANQASKGADLATENFKRHLKLQQQIADTVISKLGTPNTSEMDPTMAGGILNANGTKTDPPEPSGGKKSGQNEPAAGSGTTGDPGNDAIEFFEDKDEDNGEEAPEGGAPS